MHTLEPEISKQHMINERLIPGKEVVIDGGDRLQEIINTNNEQIHKMNVGEPPTASKDNTNTTVRAPLPNLTDNTDTEHVHTTLEDVLDFSQFNIDIAMNHKVQPCVGNNQKYLGYGTDCCCCYCCLIIE
jgi:hypothetical protein